ncbi:unnamed protein product [Prorocentrum cordatum]|uniref:Glutathione gamma-glutamylcysteinyltransferase n=1 Tax=Prorocentrum cordatum TaxID=2364126 RepID=A0ABN9V9B8_9DINO|nr:unnamed protein product [Polarella glacialis]
MYVSWNLSTSRRGHRAAARCVIDTLTATGWQIWKQSGPDIPGSTSMHPELEAARLLISIVCASLSPSTCPTDGYDIGTRHLLAIFHEPVSGRLSRALVYSHDATWPAQWISRDAVLQCFACRDMCAEPLTA